MKTTQHEHVPALRFKDEQGEDYPGWEKKQFSHIAKKVSDSYSPINSEECFECVELESLSSESGQVLKTFNSRGQKSIKTKFVKGDVLFGKLRPYLKKYYRAQFDGVCTSEIWVLRPKSVSSKFLYCIVQSCLFIRMANIQSGSKMPRSDWRVISQSIFIIPSDDDEQQKIATFLSSVDTKIEQLTKKKTLWEQYKKGMMQKLFSQEIRFKDAHGDWYPNWEEKSLSKVISPEFRKTNKPNKKYLAVGVRSHMKGTFHRQNTDPNTVSVENLYVVRKDDLIVNITFAWEGAIAIVTDIDNGGYVSHRFPTYTCKDKFLLPGYIKQIILMPRFKYLLRVISPGGAGRNRVLNRNEFLKLKWTFPLVEEQQKIAAFLFAIDQKIELTDTEIKQAQAFKKGLLQQMFI